jgi:hypothetical protein
MDRTACRRETSLLRDVVPGTGTSSTGIDVTPSLGAKDQRIQTEGRAGARLFPDPHNVYIHTQGTFFYFELVHYSHDIT